MNLDTPIKILNKVGEKTARHLSWLNIKTVGDLLYYFPFRYEDFSKIFAIKDLVENEIVTISGTIELINNRRAPRWKKIITEALVSDKTGSIKIVWFNQPFIIKTLKIGDDIYVSGKVRRDMFGLQMTGPIFEKKSNKETKHTARLVPIYPLTSGITQKQMRFLASQVLGCAESVPEWLPKEILEKYDLCPVGCALKGVHFPKDRIDLIKCIERLKFDEIFLLQIKGELARMRRSKECAPEILFKKNEIQSFVSKLPFVLTKAQKVASWEVLQDLSKKEPMNRLLSGDVGSGKTVVAALALFSAALNDFQSVFMAPTEILARQHFDSLIKLLGDKADISLLTQSQAASSKFKVQSSNQSASRRTKSEKEKLLNLIAGGGVQIIIGTHALLSEGVEFKNLGLVIVDEQHRFGVGQRKTMKDKGAGAHFLSMTATPIPRSLALTLYGDLDLSILGEIPPGRKKILTRLVSKENRHKAYDFIRNQIKSGRQVFVICPLISPKEDVGQKDSEEENVLEKVACDLKLGICDDKKTVMSEYKKLSEKIFPDLRVGFLHGRMRAKEKEGTMDRFKKGELDILVSTSVIEVGVDVPNASVMMVEGAEYFGLAQLHQFRGRVGRSTHQSYCFIFTETTTDQTRERLRYFEANSDGFKLAEKDLASRGPGEVYGTLQSGFSELRLAKITDVEIIKKARETAKTIAPNLDKYSLLSSRFKKWQEEVHLE